MFEMKIVLTVIVTLLLIAGFLGGTDSVKGFFDTVAGGFSLSDGARDVAFALVADNYSAFSFIARGVNLTVDGSTRAVLKTGNLQTNKTLSVYGFQGTGSITGNSLMLNGKIAKVSLPEITVGVQETIDAESVFTGLDAVNLELEELTIRGTGSLTVGNTTTQFSGDITLVDPAGTVQINRDGRVFYLSGSAGRISIPGSGIVVD